MTAESSKQQTAGEGALPLLYDSWNLARRAMSVGLIKPALDSTDDLLETIRGSTANRPEYIELEQSCVGVCEALGRGTNRKQDDYLSQSALEAIEELTTIVDKIKRNIVKQGKRSAISRAFWPRKEKEAIATWILSLNQILCVLEIEFGCDEPVSISGPRQNVAEPHSAAPDFHHSGSATPTAPHGTPDPRTAASEVPTEVVNVHIPDHETHRNITETIDGTRSLGCSTHVSLPDRSMPPLRNTNEMAPDIFSRAEEMHIIADTDEMTDGMPQQTNRGTRDRHQVVTKTQAAESISGESPPRPQRIFGRDELVKHIVDLADTDSSTPIALIGTGGIGKTSVALAVLHDDRMRRRFGDHRRLLRCDQFPASLPNFLRRLSEVIGAGIPNPADLASLRPFLSQNRMLIIIDNTESIFGGPTSEDIERVVEELTQFRNIWLCITSRTSTIPTRCRVIDVPTLSMEPARETFHNAYRGEQSDAVDDILEQLDFHPLSVILLATAARQNKWDTGQLKREWEGQRTGVLRARHHASLAATIEFSLRSPMFLDLGPHARDLLGVVAFFPLGVDENNLDWLFPFITDRRKIFGRFCDLSLAHRNKDFITMLAPLRDHLRPKDPTSASLLCSVKGHYLSRLSFYVGITTHDSDRTTWFASEDVNVEHLLDIFTSIDINSESVWDACEHFIRHLYHHKPRLPVFVPKIGALPDDYPPKLPCLLELASLYGMIGNSAERRRLLCHALRLCRMRRDDYEIASTLHDLAAISSSPDLCEEGIQQAREAITIFQRLGDMMGVTRSYTQLSFLFRHANRFDDAEKCENQAIGLIDALMPTADSTSCGSLHGFLHRIYSRRGDTKKANFHAEAAFRTDPARLHQLLSHCTLAKIRTAEGRFGDAEAHLEHARPLAANGSSELGMVMLLRGHLLRVQGKFEEARIETLCALDSAEEFGGVDDVEKVKVLLRLIDEEMDGWESLVKLLTSLAGWSGAMIRAVLGGDISQDEKIHKTATKMMALLEKDGNRPGGPNFFQIIKASEEFKALVGRSDGKEVNGAIAECLDIPTAADEPGECPHQNL